MLAAVATAMSSAAHAAPPAPLKYSDALQQESKSQSACETLGNHIFVKHEFGSDCIAYFVTKGSEARRQAVVFLDGDIPVEQLQDPDGLASSFDGMKKVMQIWADRLKVRYVFVSRLGVNGSSGNHGERRKPNETYAMMAATDLLKTRLGLDSIAIAGQSGGSTLAASFLTLGRTDVTCAILGSGAFELADLEYRYRTGKGYKVTKAALSQVMYDPSAHVADIKPSADRRILILGDRADTRTPFDQQLRFAEDIRAAGHHARVIPLLGSGENEHGATQFTLPAAGACLNKMPDEKIARAIQQKPDNARAQAAPQTRTAPVAQTVANVK